MAHPLDSFFNPKTVAMIGATEEARKIAGRRWKTLVESGFDGPLYPIHPRATAIRGHKAYRRLTEVPGPVDLAIVVVPSDAVASVVEDCVALGVGGVVLISGGFAESGAEGRAREADLVDRMRAAGARMIGPNCAGLASLPAKMNITGFDIPAGRVGLISQSGNLALNLSYLAGRSGGGFSRQVTIGNTADLGVVELTDYLLHDPETDVVLIYLEGWRDGEGRQLVDTVRASENRKPIVILNPGATETGRRAALSHTGALAASHRVAAGAYRQAGIVQVHDIEEAWLVARSLCDLPPLAPSGRLAVLSDGGGHATLTCDALDRAGLKVQPFGGRTRQRLDEQLPDRCAIDNPVDFAGVAETEPAEISPVLETCLADPEIDGAILVGHFGGYHTIGGSEVLPAEDAAAESCLQAVQAHSKPLLIHSVHGRRDLPPLQRLRAGGVPVSDSIPVLAAVAGQMRNAAMGAAEDADKLSSQPDESVLRDFLEAAAAGPPRWLMEPEARAFMQLFGVDVPPFSVVAKATDCAAELERLGAPVAMKRIAPDSVHKSRGGGVALNVADAPAAEAAFRHLSVPGPTRVLITPMIRDGTEIVVGGVRDRQFGPVVMLGLGGVAIETLDDVTFRPAPVGPAEARAMFGELRSRGMFFKEQDSAAAGLDAAARLVSLVSHILAGRAEIAEIDLNPVFLRADGPVIADARIVLT